MKGAVKDHLRKGIRDKMAELKDAKHTRSKIDKEIYVLEKEISKLHQQLTPPTLKGATP